MTWIEVNRGYSLLSLPQIGTGPTVYSSLNQSRTNCVLFPEPVSPMRTVTWLSRMVVVMYSLQVGIHRKCNLHDICYTRYQTFFLIGWLIISILVLLACTSSSFSVSRSLSRRPVNSWYWRSHSVLFCRIAFLSGSTSSYWESRTFFGKIALMHSSFPSSSAIFAWYFIVYNSLPWTQYFS